MSGRAIEASGDVDTLLLDKTGTITIGNRVASELIPSAGVSIDELAVAAFLASAADETPEGRSIVALIRERYGRAVPAQLPPDAQARGVHRADAHERLRRRRPRAAQGRGRRGRRRT